MKAVLCLAGLTLLLSTLVEGSAFRHQTRKELKRPITHALRNISPGKFLKNKKISVRHHGPNCHVKKCPMQVYFYPFQLNIILTLKTALRSVALSFRLHLHFVTWLDQPMRTLTGTALRATLSLIM